MLQGASSNQQRRAEAIAGRGDTKRVDTHGEQECCDHPQSHHNVDLQLQEDLASWWLVVGGC